MKHCKCGMPIYDEPEQPSDKCRECTRKGYDKVAERLFESMNLKEKKDEQKTY